MRVQYFASEAWEESYVREKLKGVDLVFHVGTLADLPEVSDPKADALCIFVDSHVGEGELNRFPALKLIATRSTGYDHINLDATKAKNISIATVPFYGENTVAEFAFALILSLSRRIPEAYAHTKSGGFSPQGMRGFDLAGKTLGVVGTGHIGAHVIKMGQGFGMNVVGFDAFPNAELATKIGFTYLPLPELLATSDVITIHVPYNEHTHHLLNKENIAGVKKGAYLINTARGAVLETEALVWALQTEILAGAGLDVLEEEGDMADEMKLLSSVHPKAEDLKLALENHYLIEHPRVIVTPHCAFNTKEAIERILDTTVHNLKEFDAGSPENIVK